MSVRLNPYHGFRDSAREAMEFYRSAFGGGRTMHTFAEFRASEDPAEHDKIMHSMLVTPDALVLMGADTPNSMGGVRARRERLPGVAQRRRGRRAAACTDKFDSELDGEHRRSREGAPFRTVDVEACSGRP